MQRRVPFQFRHRGRTRDQIHREVHCALRDRALLKSVEKRHLLLADLALAREDVTLDELAEVLLLPTLEELLHAPPLPTPVFSVAVLQEEIRETLWRPGYLDPEERDALILADCVLGDENASPEELANALAQPAVVELMHDLLPRPNAGSVLLTAVEFWRRQADTLIAC